MIYLKLLYSFFITLLAGKMLLNLKYFDVSDEHPLIRFPLYFFAGSSVISLLMFALSLLGIPFGVFAISLPFLIYLVYALFNLRAMKINLDLKLADILDLKSPLFTGILAVLILLGATMLINCMLAPIFSTDATSRWFLKAKMLFWARTIPYDIFRLDVYKYAWPDYPLLVPLNLAWISLCLGQWNDILLRVFFAMQYILSIPFLYLSLRQYISKRHSAIACFLLFTNPQILHYSNNGLVDFALGLFAAISMVYLVKWIDHGQNRHLYLSSFFIGSAVFVKNDGIALFLAVLLTLLLCVAGTKGNQGNTKRNAFHTLLSFLGISVAIFAPFRLMAHIHSLSSHMIKNIDILPSMASNLGNIPMIAGRFLYGLYLDTGNWYYFWIILTLLIILGRKNFHKSGVKYILPFLLLSLLIFFAVYLLPVQDSIDDSSVLPLLDYMEGTLHRILLGLAPTALIFAFTISFMGESRAKKGEEDDPLEKSG